MTYETIQYEVRGGVAVITLNRPESLNALTLAVAGEFKAALAEAARQGARAIVLTGAGRAFCAGGDLRECRKSLLRMGVWKLFLTNRSGS